MSTPSEAQMPCSFPSSSPANGNEDDTALPIRTASAHCAPNGSRTAPRETSNAARRLVEALISLPFARSLLVGRSRHQKARAGQTAIVGTALGPIEFRL